MLLAFDFGNAAIIVIMITMFAVAVMKAIAAGFTRDAMLIWLLVQLFIFSVLCVRLSAVITARGWLEWLPPRGGE